MRTLRGGQMGKSKTKTKAFGCCSVSGPGGASKNAPHLRGNYEVLDS